MWWILKKFYNFTSTLSTTHHSLTTHSSPLNSLNLMSFRLLRASFRGTSFVLLTLTLLSTSFLLSSCSQEKMFNNRMEGTWIVKMTDAGNGVVAENAVSTGSFTFTDDNRGTYSLNTTSGGKITSESGSFTWNGSDFVHCPEDMEDDDDHGNDGNGGYNGNNGEEATLGNVAMVFTPSEQGQYSRTFRIIKNEKLEQIWKTNPGEAASVVTTATLTKK